MKTRIANIRRAICAGCQHRQQCEPYTSGSLNHNDPAASCPRTPKLWGVYYGEGGVAPAPEPPLNSHPATWAELHLRALLHKGGDDSAWLLTDFTPRIRGFGCQCRQHFLALLKQIPPRWDDYFACTVQWHNAVNARLERDKKLYRPQVSLADAEAFWRSKLPVATPLPAPGKAK